MGDFMDILNAVFRCIVFYVVIAISYRIMGKREIGELSIMDFIVSLFLAQLASISIENLDDSIFVSMGPILLLVVIQLILSKISFNSENVRNALDGDVSVIINRGKINFEEMLKQRYNLDDLLAQLREKSIKSIEEVDYAILETSGKLSVFKVSDDKSRSYPLPVIIDGKVQEDVLYQIKKTKGWLEEKLKDEDYKLEEVFYGFYKKNNLYIIKNDTIK